MVKFYSDNPYYFIRYDNIGYFTDDIHSYNTGIQFIQGIYSSDDINTIKALRNYIRKFINKGIKPPIWEEGQSINGLQDTYDMSENVEKMKKVSNDMKENYKSNLSEIEGLLKR